MSSKKSKSRAKFPSRAMGGLFSSGDMAFIVPAVLTGPAAGLTRGMVTAKLLTEDPAELATGAKERNELF